MNEPGEIDESKFPYGYLPPHLDERVKNCRSLTIGERLELSLELSEAGWAKIGVVRDPNKPMDKSIRRITRTKCKVQCQASEAGHSAPGTVVKQLI